MNLLILIFHVSVISGLTLMALRFGKEAIIAWLCLLALAMNLFVLKQITLFNFDVTATDALAVGYLLGLNLIQEYYGKKVARKTVWITFFVTISFVLLSQILLLYQPNRYDVAQPHLDFLFSPLPRLVIASLATFLIVQFLDIALFAYLREKLSGNYLTLRTTLSLICSQTLDTLLFSILGLWGIVHSIGDLILLSLLIKGIVILLAIPYVTFSKRVVGAV